MNSLDKRIIKVVDYFGFFSYSPTFEEIYTFLNTGISQKTLKKELSRLISEKQLVSNEGIVEITEPEFLIFNFKFLNADGVRYTLPQYSSKMKYYKKKRLLSQAKLRKAKLYFRFLSFVPQVHFVGLTGSLAMSSAKDTDDIDICIVSSIGKMWTARFIANVLAILMGLKRKRGVKKAKDKVCLNLFFDTSHMIISKNKQTEYVAHEVLQMKPLINKKNSYEKFLWKNKWVFKIYPNANKVYKNNIKHLLKSDQKNKETIYSHRSKLPVMDILEKILRKIQLVSINRHKTKEIVTDTQLWFFPEDFEKKL